MWSHIDVGYCFFLPDIGVMDIVAASVVPQGRLLTVLCRQGPLVSLDR